MGLPSMLRSRPSGCGRYIFWGIVVVTALYLFRFELGFIWNFIKAFPDLLVRIMEAGWNAAPELFLLTLFVVFNAIMGYCFFYLLQFIMAGVVLPVRNRTERWQVTQRLWNFMTGARSPMIVVQEGKLVKELDEPDKISGGIILIDLDSAVVLERIWMPYHPSSEKVARISGRSTRFPMARVGGSGIVFVQRGEKIRGIVNLRRHFRINLGILASTRDGIEIKTNVWAMFSLGQPASIIKVAYYDGDTAEDLCVVQIDPKTRRIKSISNELDHQDKQEIHEFAQQYLMRVEPIAMLEPDDRGQDIPPYHIDPERIFAAVFSQARSINDSQIDSWADLPALEATEVFRNMLAKAYYDTLYAVEDDRRYPLLSEFKPEFGRTMRYMGVISYQFLQRYDGMFPEVGQRIEHRMFRVSPVQELRATKALRERGIKVIAAGFGELTPTDPMVLKQRLDNWRARWKMESDMQLAEYEHDEIMIRTQAHLDRQREIVDQFTRLLEDEQSSDTLVAVLKLMESGSVDTKTKQLLPQDFFNRMLEAETRASAVDISVQSFLESGLKALEEEKERTKASEEEKDKGKS